MRDLDTLSLAERSLCTTTARLLAAVASAAGALGLVCTLVGAVGLGCLAWRVLSPLAGHGPWSVQLALVSVLVVSTLLERGLALRLHFDAGLLTELAYSGAAPASLHALDQALHTLGLRRASAVCRPLLDRVRGAQRLARWHVVTVALQLLMLFGAGIGMHFGWGPA